MKKLLLIMLLITFTGIIKADEPISPLTITDTFYGTKTSNKVNNPCKGETTKVCGTRYIKYEKIYTTTRYTLYEKIIELKDGDEETISITTDYLEVPRGNTIQEVEKHPNTFPQRETQFKHN